MKMTDMSNIPKIFIDSNDLRDLSYHLAAKVLEQGFEPNYLVALWRGGTPVGAYVHEFFKKVGLKVDHIPIRTNGYDAVGKRSREVEVWGLDYIIDRIKSHDRLLFVDDVFDTGLTMQKVGETLKQAAQERTPQFKTATPYYKPQKNETLNTAHPYIPDFYLETTTEWVSFPHELEDLTDQEIEQYKGKNTLNLLKQFREKKFS